MISQSLSVQPVVISMNHWGQPERFTTQPISKHVPIESLPTFNSPPGVGKDCLDSQLPGGSKEPLTVGRRPGVLCCALGPPEIHHFSSYVADMELQPWRNFNRVNTKWGVPIEIVANTQGGEYWLLTVSNGNLWFIMANNTYSASHDGYSWLLVANHG